MVVVVVCKQKTRETRTFRVDIRNDLERREKTHGFGKFARARLAAHDDDILIYINFAFFLCLKMEKSGKVEKMFKTHKVGMAVYIKFKEE